MDQKEWADDALTGLGVGNREDDVSRRSSKTNKRTAASATSSKGTSRKKRPRSKPTPPTANSKRPQKPKPPPAPPASLVSLMKKDKSVLQFFTSLQENVTYDVDKWKHEAAHWKRVATSLPTSTSKQNGSNRTKATKSSKKVQRKTKTKDDTLTPDVMGEMNNKEEEEEEEGSTIPITDEALFGEFEDSDDDSDDDDDDKGNMNSTFSNGQIKECSERAVQESLHNSQTLQTNSSRRSLILEKVMEAKKLLDLLGVSLVVEVETKPSSANEILLQANENTVCETHLDLATNDENDINSERTTSILDETELTDKTKDNEMSSTIAMERTFQRQSDEKVVADMMASLRTLIEASSIMDNHNNESEQQNFHPFYRCGKPHCPNVYFGRHNNDKDQSESMWPKHPASLGLKYLIDALTIMDVYCHDSFEESDWELIFEDDSNQGMISVEEMTILKIGMRNRCQLVEKMLSSLHVEITRTWANSDRALNLDSSAMHFHPTDVVNEGDILDSEEEFAYSVKNFNRLVSLEEKIAHGRIASILYRRMGAFQNAVELVVGYVISAAPSLGVEHYHPKIPPALSMCVMESLISPEDHDPAEAESERNDDWFRECIQYILSSSGNKRPVESSSLLLKTIAFVTRTAADIWKERCSSSDKRIRDIALVESEAYKRLLCLSNGWFNMVGREEDDVLEISRIFTLCDVSKVSKLCTEKVSPTELGLSCIAFMVTTGKADKIISFSGNIVSSLKKRVFIDNMPSRSWQLFSLLPACCFAYSAIMSRKWELIKLESSSSGRPTAAAFSIKHEFSGILAAAADVVFALEESETDWLHANIALIQCYKLLGDALGLHRFVKRFLSLANTVPVESHHPGTCRIISSLLDAAAIPTVRVINLERRPDRLLDFMECAVSSERMLVMKGVANLKRKSSVCKTVTSICDNEGTSPGNFAYDGQCSQDELEIKVAQTTKGDCALSDFVQEKWKPSELSAFDKHAGSDFKDAQTTTSEKGCALSHIATWFGVESCLSSFDFHRGLEDNNSTAVKLNNIAGMLTITGFARGTPLLKENEAMDPSPACIILEDDAILCDRFTERIEALLDELPRDFHFCSIGYSRPKFAPIIDYSPEIGIPSCLWYLTGYILSAAGARFLISSLPVVGPVDSWIAVKMRDNFANRLGDSLGVGKHAKTHHVPLPKDLSKIMKFRAFAAQTPLCTQKQVVAQSKAKGTKGAGQGSWRAAKKDSDVEYSGF